MERETVTKTSDYHKLPSNNKKCVDRLNKQLIHYIQNIASNPTQFGGDTTFHPPQIKGFQKLWGGNLGGIYPPIGGDILGRLGGMVLNSSPPSQKIWGGRRFWGGCGKFWGGSPPKWTKIWGGWTNFGDVPTKFGGDEKFGPPQI